jgi:thiosulfate/3-mercaptopyruvate sulfurtransferase
MAISLLNVQGLQQLMKETPDNLLLVDTRPIEEYDEGHVPGAVHVAWEEWCAKPPRGLSEELDQPGYWGRLIDADETALAERLGKNGFGNEKTIVVYADGAKSKGREGRIAWMLLYFGAKDVRLLDGGYEAWVNSGAEIDKKSVSPKPAQFVVCRDERRRVMIDQLIDLIKNEPNLMLVDTRTKREFGGNDYRYMPRMGTLPDAELIAYASIFNSDGTFLSKEKFSELVNAEKQLDKKVVTFCEVGVRACTIALLLEMYTGRVTAVYDGSMMEWSSHPDLPVAIGKAAE